MLLRRIARHQRIEIVAADPALHLRKALARSRRASRSPSCEHVAKQSGPLVARSRRRAEIARHLAEMQERAVGQHGVASTACCRAWCRSAASARRRNCCRPCRRWWRATAVETSTGNHRPCGFELRVEIVEHDARLDHAGCVLDVERDDAVQVFGEIDDEAVIDGLAALRGAAAARRDGHARRRGRSPASAAPRPWLRGTTTPSGIDLVERGVGRIAAAAERVEQHVAGGLGRSRSSSVV